MNDLFHNLDEQQKNLLIHDFDGTEIKVESGQSIKSKFILVNSVGILLQGEVKIIRNDYNGSNYIISIIGENSVLGQKFFPISGQDYDIETTTDSILLILDYRIITQYFETNNQIHQQFLINLLDAAIATVKEANERISIISRKTTRDKLLEYFDFCYRKSLSKNIYLPFSFKDLADYLTVDRSAMTREIKHLKDEKIIEVKGKKITLLTK